MTRYFLLFFISFSVLAFECPKGFICASGCGLHESEADAEARAQLSKMFKVKIESNFTTIRSSGGELDESFVHETINTYVRDEIEGVIVSDRKKEEDEICAHATLNKSLFILKFKDKIDFLKKENSRLVDTKKRLVWEKIRDNNDKITSYNGLLSVLDVSDLSKVQKIPDFKILPIQFAFTIDKELENFRSLLISKTLRNGYSKVKKAKRVIDATVKMEKAVLNVAGFEKYALIYEISSFKNGKKAKAFGKIYKHGRNKEKVKELLYEEFNKKISEIFIDLNL